MSDQIILVNEDDQEIGTGEKMDVHRKGLLHRAFSVFVLNDNRELLLQRRAFHKYHSGGLWTNTCCSHPKPGVETELFIHKRIEEEMGFDCDIEYLFSFLYKKEFSNSLIEHELDYVYKGYYRNDPVPSPDEVVEWKWMDLDLIREDLIRNPEIYTYWFITAFDKFYSSINSK